MLDTPLAHALEAMSLSKPYKFSKKDGIKCHEVILLDNMSYEDFSRLVLDLSLKCEVYTLAVSDSPTSPSDDKSRYFALATSAEILQDMVEAYFEPKGNVLSCDNVHIPMNGDYAAPGFGVMRMNPNIKFIK